MNNGSKLKMFVIPIILVVILLVIQAFCDLELPEYTSQIINNGIQQGGIDSGVPEVLTEDIYEAIVIVSENDVGIIASYDLVVRDNLSKSDFEKFKKKYPKLEEGNLYILNDMSKTEKSLLEDKIAVPLIVAVSLKEKTGEIDFSNKVAMQAGKDQFSKMDKMLVKQYAASSVKSVYKDIGININQFQVKYIVNKGLVMLFIAAIGMIVAVLTGYLISKLAATISYTLRKKVVAKILCFSTGEFKEFGASSLITRSTNDIEQIKNFFIMLLRIVIFAPIMGIGAFIKVYNNPLNSIILVALIIIVIVIVFLFVVAMPKFNKMQKLIDKMNLVSREIITGMPVIRTFSTENYEEKRFDKANKNLTKTNLFVNRLMGIMMPSMMLIMNLISIAIIWFGAREIDFGTLQVGSLLAFITYTMQIIMSFLMISLVSVMLPRAWVSLKRVQEILRKEVAIKEPSNPKKFVKEARGIVEFKNVSFKYPDATEAMLKNISFKAFPGTTTAFIGSTGSGKSTLVNLIPRFFDVTEGEILVDGVNVKEATIKDLRDIIGYVPQKGMLFSGTVMSNLMLGKEKIDIHKLEESAKVSQSWDFIQKKEDGFNSEIAQGGSNVSGGQKQRLSIARAIAKNPEIYIFDDSFSALDFKTDAKLRKELGKYATDATILIVAQRISTIMNADNIIVLNEGEIVGMGKHKDLIKTCDVYREIALSQLKEEEL